MSSHTRQLLRQLSQDELRVHIVLRELPSSGDRIQRGDRAAVLDRMGVQTGSDVFKLMDVAEDIVTPMMDQPIRLDRDSLILGYAGVYSSFLLHAKRAGEKYGVPSSEILVELGDRKTVGGQEDMIEDVALNIAHRRKAETAL